MARITTESLRDLRDALDFAEYDRANEEPGAEFAANYNRRELEKLAPDLAADLIDARAAVAEERTRREAAEAEVARLRSMGDELAARLRALMQSSEAVRADERARCAAVCREVAQRERGHGDTVARMAAETCAEAIERGEVGR